MKRFRAIFALTAILAMAAVAPAQQTFKQALSQMRIDQKLGSQVPGDAVFKDEEGKEIQFGSLLGQRPVVILPMFFGCQGICGTEVDGVLKNVAKMKGAIGKDYDVVLLSINPNETSELARDKKISLLKVFDGKADPKGFHLLTGDLDNIRKVTDALGFGFAYDATDKRINHPAGLMILTPKGQVSSYMFGSEYPQLVMQDNIALAGKGKIGGKAEVDLLGCVMLDAKTKSRSATIEKFINLTAGFFALCTFIWIGVMAFKYRREPLAANPNSNDGGSPTRA